MPEEICPVAEAAKILGDRWTLIILRDLADGPRRFGELAQSGDGISPSILSGRLRELEEQRIVTRKSYNEVSPRVVYALTEKGRDALRVVDVMREFGNRWLLPELLRLRGRVEA